MSIQFLDPRAEPGAPIEPYELAADWSSGTPSIGLLANGFPDSVPFLEEVQIAIKERLPEASVEMWNKGDASSIASAELVMTIAERVDAVIAAYGH